MIIAGKAAEHSASVIIFLFSFAVDCGFIVSTFSVYIGRKVRCLFAWRCWRKRFSSCLCKNKKIIGREVCVIGDSRDKD